MSWEGTHAESGKGAGYSGRIKQSEGTMSNDVLKGISSIATDRNWLWSTPIRILFVIDGRIVLSKDAQSFGLGYVLETLADQSGWWVSFEVDVAKRDGCLQTEDLGGYELKYHNFRFTDPGFDLDSYDQVWLFGDQPSQQDGADGVTTDNDIAAFALAPAERKLLAEWMDRGGGVFATGDHSILGASLCSGIPRVRTMRKWTHAQGVPSRDGSSRHETIQPPGSESDTVLQPVEIVYRRAGGLLPFSGPLVPHPILSSTLGVIDRFPDHMHEGEVIADEAVQLDRPLNIPGYHRPEYPSVVPEVLASGDVATLPVRPRPRVIAYGQTTNLNPPEATLRLNLLPSLTGPEFPGPFGFSKRFGLVGAYDGDAVGIGRVVVDSTWHHWFSYNVVQIATGATTSYRKMQDYYRNVGLWLTKPGDRQLMLIAGIWGVLSGSAPMEFGPNDSPWEIGERVLATLGATASAAMLQEFVGSFLDRRLFAAASAPHERSAYESRMPALPEDLTNRAVVGGIGSSLLEIAIEHRNLRARGQRPRMNNEAIRRRAVDGVSLGLDLLRKAIDDAAKAYSAMSSELAFLGKPQIELRIPIKSHRLRIIAEALQLPDPSDPALIDGRAVVSIRIRQDDDDGGGTPPPPGCFQDIVLPSFEVRGGLNKLDGEVGAFEVQTGESLTVEVLAGRESTGREAIRFRETLRGEASSWIGKRAPAPSQAWRLWYRIEDVVTR
jgi:hypothetical protein